MELKEKSIYYPPGGILIWIIIYLELITFGMAIIALAYYGSEERDLFHNNSLKLNKTIGTINTILLLTSGFFVAKGIQYFKVQHIKKTLLFFNWAIVGGFGFLVLKSIEYYEKLKVGLTMDYNSFFTFYWLLTGFHLIHVIVGLVLLIVNSFSITKKQTEASFEDIEASASFWHMCDLIWLLLFPVLYLLF